MNDNNNLTLPDFLARCDLVVNGIAAELGADRLMMTDTFNGMIRKLSADVFSVESSGVPKSEKTVHNCGSVIDLTDVDLLNGLFNYYCGLCLKYNQKVYAIQFCIFINVSYSRFKEWLFGVGNVSKDLKALALKVKENEEGDQVTATDVKSMFRLKSMHGYTETPTQINIITATTDDTARLLEKYKDLPQLNG